MWSGQKVIGAYQLIALLDEVLASPVMKEDDPYPDKGHNGRMNQRWYFL